MLDVAGLVPGASEGKGMGNQFLDDLRRANALIHVVDTSGTTDSEGNPVEYYNPVDDIKWLNEELAAWIGNILYRDWDRVSKRLDADRTKLAEVLTEKLSGLGTSLPLIKSALMPLAFSDNSPKSWSEEEKLELADILREKIFPIVIAANKIDRPKSLENYGLIKEKYPELHIVQTTGLAELVLRKATNSGLIKYSSGSMDFEVLLDDHKDKKLNAVLMIKEKLLDQDKSTGTMQLLEICAFKILNLVVVFPVEDTTHLTDQDGRILPDAFLVPSNTTAKEFAGKIHSDLAESFIHAILVNQSNKRISASHELRHGDIVKIVSAAK
jgi:ribosome-binding ATPase YchF (GTP1/OBG family)